MLRRNKCHSTLIIICMALLFMFFAIGCDCECDRETNKKPDLVADLSTPVIIKISDLNTMDSLPEAPVLFYFTQEEFAKAIGDVDTVDAPIPLDVPHIEIIPISGYSSSSGFLVQFDCLPMSVDTECGAKMAFGPDGGKILECRCGQDIDTSYYKTLPPACFISLSPRPGVFFCNNNYPCDEDEKCRLRISRGWPKFLFCECLK